MYFGVVMFLLLMFLLTKQIIEKNSQSIAMTKILGFKNGEIAKLYLLATSAAVVISLLLSMPIIHLLLQWAFRYYLYVKMSGYIPYIISNTCYVKLFVMGIASYAVVAALMLLKIKKVPMGEALKNQNL
jgi:putative ABC transport system permease protein